MVAAGKLYVVATPIGNLQDISLRALEVLGRVANIAAEDTRITARLLSQHGIKTSMLAYHEHNESRQAARLLELLRQGRSIALVSDAGTPLISDPGYRLIAAAREAGMDVIPIPGACAAIAALSVAGLPTDRFHFEGFLPSRHGAREKRLRQLFQWPHTCVLYESAHRLQATLECVQSLAGEDYRMSLCRELTKQFETVLTLPVSAILRRLQEDANQRRGEFVLILPSVQAAEQNEVTPQAQALYTALREQLSAAQAAKVTAKVTGVPRKALYTLASND